MKYIMSNKLLIIGVIVGSIAGYLYYHFVGCSGGSCAITSRPLNSTLYGAMLGGLMFNGFKPDDKKQKNKSDE